jgi:hypothetical protein
VSTENFWYGPVIGSAITELPRHEGQKMLRLGGKLPRWLVLLLTAVIGVVLIILPVFVRIPTPYETIPRDFGIVFLVGSVLAFTIDRWAKDELREDAVKATLSSVIRDEFRSELQRIFNYEVLCDHHFMRISIDRISEDRVRVTVTTERRLRNISGSSREIPGLVHIDEWGFEEQKSSITNCSIQGEGGQEINVFAKTTSNAYSIKAETDRLTIPPGKTATARSTVTEIRRANDHFINTFLHPTKDPTVVVQISDDLSYEFDFGRSLSPGERIEHSEQMSVHRLVGMYFPGFYMKARWWPKGWSAAID